MCTPSRLQTSFVFYFNDTATTEIYTLSLHDALPISSTPDPRTGAHVAPPVAVQLRLPDPRRRASHPARAREAEPPRSEEHTSELQSRQYLVCRLLLEKKKKLTANNPLPFHE